MTCPRTLASNNNPIGAFEYYVEMESEKTFLEKPRRI